MTTLETIRHLRDQHGYSQDYMAQCLAMSQNNYSKLELGKVKLTVEQLEKIAAVFGKSATELLDFKDENQLGAEVVRLQQQFATLEGDVSLLKKLATKLLSGGGVTSRPIFQVTMGRF